MANFLRRFFSSDATAPAVPRPRFRPTLEALGDRITPTINFAGQLAQTVGTQPQGIATGDFNNDGRVDAVSTNSGANTVSVLLNATGATTAVPAFLPQQTFTVGSNPLGVAVGDVNGDGRADIVVANYNASTVSVLLNTTPLGSTVASFAAQQTFTLGTTTGPQAIALADINNDGRLDIAVSGYTSNTVAVLLNTTSVASSLASFGIAQTFTVQNGPAAIVAADFNGDGRIDLATANYSNNSITILRNTTTPLANNASFATPLNVTTATLPLGLVAADFNGDGLPELASAASGASGSTVSVIRNTSVGGSGVISFAPQQTFSVGQNPTAVSAADVDGDGRADLLVANRNDNTVSVLANSSAALATTLTFATQQTFATDTGPVGVAAADFTNDGRADIASANITNGTVSVIRNTSTNLPTTGPVLAGQFGTTGVWAFNRVTSAWVNLTAANATALSAAPNGNLVASFGAAGLWYYRPSAGWGQIDQTAPAAIAIDPASGNVVANFTSGPKIGTFIYRLSSSAWTQLGTTQAAANIVAVSANGDVFANFTSFGVYRFRATTDWVQLNGNTASTLSVDPQGYVVASFATYGIGQYIPFAQGWRALAPATTATSIAIDSYGNVFASLANVGVSRWSYLTGSWTTLTPNASANTIAADSYGNLAAAFTGFGVWEYNAFYGWQQRRTTEVTFLNLE